MPQRRPAAPSTIVSLTSAVLVVSLAACGGTIGNVSTDGAKDGGGGGGTQDGGTQDGGSGDSGSCSTAPFAGNRACVPGAARSNRAIAIDVDATEGCLGCFTTFAPCAVDVVGNVVKVSMVTRTCPPPGDQACPAICALPRVQCTLPPLAAGTYTVEVGGQPTTGGAPRSLVVTDDATATSCNLPGPGDKVLPLDGSVYSTSCSTDADCVPATVGDVCTPCSCPNVAIAKSALASYQADVRARTSQCAPLNGQPACAACRAPTVGCEIKPGALTGTCKLVP